MTVPQVDDVVQDTWIAARSSLALSGYIIPLLVSVPEGFDIVKKSPAATSRFEEELDEHPAVLQKLRTPE